MPSEWVKSSFSTPDGNNCVETRQVGNMIAMRDGKLGDDSPVLYFTPDEWRAFLAGAADGQFDVG